MPRFNDITETIGRTPVVRVHRLAPAHVELYVKLEARNPMASVKDRLAFGVIDAATRAGVLKPGQTVIEATIGKAVELAEKNGWFLARQFENEANADIHSRTTALEILEDFTDGLDYWVTGYGTGGTLKGVARVLKQRTPQTLVVVCEPDNSQVYGSRQPLAWPADGIPRTSHPRARAHPMQGWAPDFIPKLAE